MNAQPLHKKVAFFMLAKRPSPLLPLITQTALQNRLSFLERAHHNSFDQITAQGDVDTFYQCLAHSLTAGTAWRDRWIQLEIQYLASKLQHYYAHLAAICKAEDVYLNKKARVWDVKFPWETKEYPILVGNNEIHALAQRALDLLREERTARWFLEQRMGH